MSATMTMPGAWEINEQACTLPQEVATAFAEATQGLLGARYVPLGYLGKKLVSGNDYALVCAQTIITREPLVRVVVMTIYAPLTGKAMIAGIEPLPLM